jgi:choline transport protein
MSPPESIELQTKQNNVVNIEPDVRTDNGGSLYSQTRTRRLFSFSQLFAFSLTYMALWEGMCTLVIPSLFT